VRGQQQRARDRHALLLAAGQLARRVIGAAAETDAAQEPARSLAHVVGRAARDQRR
jgi:hypothetical protein